MPLLRTALHGWAAASRRRTAAVRRRYDRLAPHYDRRWLPYVEATLRETLARVEIRSTDRILDVGCGTGSLLLAVGTRLPETGLVGADLSLEMLAAASRKLRGRASLVVADASRLPFRNRCFDLVLSSNALHYLRDPRDGLAEMGRVLDSDGRIAITDWCDDYLACKIADLLLRFFEPAHFRTYGSRELERLLGDAGFRDIRVARYKIDWLWGLMTARGKTPKTGDISPDG